MLILTIMVGYMMRGVFDGGMLTSLVKTFDDFNGFLPPKGTKPGHIYDRMIPPDVVRRRLDTVKGHLVWTPMQFLRDANMAEKGLTVNQLTESIYT